MASSQLQADEAIGSRQNGHHFCSEPELARSGYLLCKGAGNGTEIDDCGRRRVDGSQADDVRLQLAQRGPFHEAEPGHAVAHTALEQASGASAALNRQLRRPPCRRSRPEWSAPRNNSSRAGRPIRRAPPSMSRARSRGRSGSLRCCGRFDGSRPCSPARPARRLPPGSRGAAVGLRPSRRSRLLRRPAVSLRSPGRFARHEQSGPASTLDRPCAHSL